MHIETDDGDDRELGAEPVEAVREPPREVA